jgi:hypothetical protein
MEESRTLRLKLGFKYCTKSDTIIDVINSQSLWQNTLKKTSKTRGMPPIKLGHGLECWKKILTFPQCGNEDHLVGSERKDNWNLGINFLCETPHAVVALKSVVEALCC